MKIDNFEVNYIQYGKGQDVILLHGWGQNIEMMNPIGEGLKDLCKITIIDLPGFGKSGEPSCEYSYEKYLKSIEKIIKKLNITNPILIGHSFGGKLAILYASRNETKKLVLLGTPGYRKVSLKIKLRVLLVKIFKKIPGFKKIKNKMYKNFSSTDYKNASEVMKKILKESISKKYKKDMQKIKCPTLIMLGTNDTAVPVSVGKKMQKDIKDSALILYDGLTHYAYIEDINRTLRILKSFIAGK